VDAVAVGRNMPAVVTLDDLTAMNDADEFHRYELSPAGVLTVWPSPGYVHAVVASRLIGWLAAAGVPAERMAQAVGLRIPCHDGVGGRVPDLIVWSESPTAGIWLPADDVLLVAEIIAPASEDMDTVTKPTEYAAAGIPRYWVIDQDSAQTVTMHRLDGDTYTVQATMPLAWVLNTDPAEHDLG
jgi:Uma2 family endonuclease